MSPSRAAAGEFYFTVTYYETKGESTISFMYMNLNEHPSDYIVPWVVADLTCRETLGF